MNILTFEQWCEKNPMIARCPGCKGSGLRKPSHRWPNGRPCLHCKGSGLSRIARVQYELDVDTITRAAARWRNGR